MQPNQLPRTGEMVVSRYIENPMCIDGKSTLTLLPFK